MGKMHVYLGEVGSATKMKLVVNMIMVRAVENWLGVTRGGLGGWGRSKLGNVIVWSLVMEYVCLLLRLIR